MLFVSEPCVDGTARISKSCWKQKQRRGMDQTRVFMWLHLCFESLCADSLSEMSLHVWSGMKIIEPGRRPGQIGRGDTVQYFIQPIV